MVSTVVPMVKERGLFCCRALLPTETGGGEGQSAAEILQTIVHPAVVASAFHTVPAAHLQKIECVLDIDVLIASDDPSATVIVTQLVADIPNLRPLNVGRLENSKCIESITPLLLNAALLNHLREPSIRIVPWMPTSYTH